MWAAKTTNHEIGGLAFIAENLVKNWEIEASFKMNLKDWRTVNPEKCKSLANHDIQLSSMTDSNKINSP